MLNQYNGMGYSICFLCGSHDIVLFYHFLLQDQEHVFWGVNSTGDCRWIGEVCQDLSVLLECLRILLRFVRSFKGVQRNTFFFSHANL